MQTPLKGGCRTRKKKNSIPVASSMKVSILEQDHPVPKLEDSTRRRRGINHVEKMTQFRSRTDARGETSFSTATGQLVLDNVNDHLTKPRLTERLSSTEGLALPGWSVAAITVCILK
jgi:hypothetical protein